MRGPMLTFSPESHTYKLDGKVLPGVSEILKGMGFIPAYRDDGGLAVNYGTIVHKTLELLDNNALESFDPAIEPLVKKYVEWKKNFGIYEMSVEKQCCCETYAGCLDRLAYLENDIVVIDIKTGNPYSWHKWQLAGYGGLCKATKYGCLYVSNEKCEFVEYPVTDEMIEEFQVLAQAYVIRKKYKFRKDLE